MINNTPRLPRRIGPAFLLTIFLASILASCNFPTAGHSLTASTSIPTQNPTNNPVVETVNALAETVVPSPTDTLSPTGTPLPTDTMSPTDTLMPGTVTPNQFTVIADKSAANIRRGPGLAFNAVGGLVKGATTTVFGRNSDGTWIYVAIPDQPGKFGWVTSLAQYVTVSVNPMDLPLTTYDQPVPAYIQNCTDHTLLVTPGNITIADRNNTNHKVQLFPNIYFIYDENVKDSSDNIMQIRTVTLVEGQTIDIAKDGKGKVYSCP
ncbi:MAG: hypothetical protein P4L50_03920 [Anaerolineaceae bacterium]|nr:hypothetical protein [Anaerolineaceae bacterium]